MVTWKDRNLGCQQLLRDNIGKVTSMLITGLTLTGRLRHGNTFVLQADQVWYYIVTFGVLKVYLVAVFKDSTRVFL
jgi:hypothetical protein